MRWRRRTAGRAVAPRSRPSGAGPGCAAGSWSCGCRPRTMRRRSTTSRCCSRSSTAPAGSGAGGWRCSSSRPTPTTGLGNPAPEWQLSNGETDDPRHLFPFLHEFVAPPPDARAAAFDPPPDMVRPDIKFAFGELPARGAGPSRPEAARRVRLPPGGARAPDRGREGHGHRAARRPRRGSSGSSGTTCRPPTRTWPATSRTCASPSPTASRW
jgi:hypothetical protein